ncbi:MAG TPA: type IV toxin-antitoxin system AbiEi family antitoxin domain-containing protein [Propionibacteriaceae bacterium]
MSVRLTRDLVAEGCSHNELAQRTRAGVLTRVRRGAYVDGWPSDPTVRHLRLVEATWQLNAVDAVVSHLSAAVVHGLPVASTSLGPVQLTRDNAPGGKIRGAVHLYATTLDADEVIELQGLRVTSLARTVVDVGRMVSFEQSVMTGDAALRLGLTGPQLQACLGRSTRRPGVACIRAGRAWSTLSPLRYVEPAAAGSTSE